MKIAVIGYSGAGKSTLAARLGELYRAPVLHLDTVQFLPDWQIRPIEDGRRIVHNFMQRENWIIDGNYSKFFREERLEQADMIIFLDFPRFKCLYYAFSRYIKYRGKTRPDMAVGCNEKFDREFFWWILHKQRTKKYHSQYKQICRKYKDKLIRLKSRRAANELLQEIINREHP